MDCSPPGSSSMGILQARILEWVAMPSSRGFSQPRDQAQVSHIAGGFFTKLSKQGSPMISIPLIRGIKKKIKMSLFTKQKRTHRHRKYTQQLSKGKGRGRDKLASWD